MTAHALDHRATRADATPDLAPERPLLDLLGPGGLASAAQADELRAIQMKGDGDGEAIHEAAAHGISGPGGPLPHGERIQAAFGRHDVSDVQAHVGGAAAEAAMLMNAQAYATGRSVAFAETPDLHTAAHEAAHVVQQRGGVSLKGGVGQAGDTHERHADAVADAVVAGRSAEGLLDRYAGAGGAPAIQRQEAAPTAAAADAGQGLDALVAALGAARTKGERTAAATALTDWCRAHLVDEAGVRAFLARPDVSAEEKTRVLGELRVAIARNEFLLGWSYHGGVDTIGRDGWETTPVDGKTPRNKGPYPSSYLGMVESRDGEEWCTSFAGQTHTRLGFTPGPRDEKLFKREADWQTSAGSIFWSGSRLFRWAGHGTAGGGRAMTAPEDVIAEGKGGSERINYRAWSRLRRTLQRKPEGERGPAVEAFTDAEGAPQAGDVLLLGRDNDMPRGKSHTALVESYDASSHVIYTIEGNTDQAVRGRKFDLTDPDVVSQIVAVIRVGADFFGAEAAAGDAPAPAPADAAPAAGPMPSTAVGPPAPDAPTQAAGPSGETLVEAMKAINRKIAVVARGQKWLKGDDDDATAYALGGGEDAANARVD